MSIDYQTIKAQFPLVEVVARYVQLVRVGGRYKGLCPFHDDTNPSFTIYHGHDGFDRYRCFSCNAGAEGGDVIDFIAAIQNVTKVEACEILTDGKIPEVGEYSPPPIEKSQIKLWTPIVPAPEDAPKYNPRRTYNPERGRFVTWNPAMVDPYLDADGRILCYVVRLEFNDGGKACITVTYCEGPGGKLAWCAKRMDPPLPLLGLDLLAARPEDAVLIVSGEKCWRVAKEHLPSFVPVSWMGGDKAVESADLRPLVGRWILFHPDADKDGSGQEAMLKMANLIEKGGTG